MGPRGMESHRQTSPLGHGPMQLVQNKRGFAKETFQLGNSGRNFSSPFAGKSHRLLVVGGHNDPVALGILGNGIQYHVERSIVASQPQAKECVSERVNPRGRALVCPLPPHPPVICVLPAGVDGVLAALFLC